MKVVQLMLQFVANRRGSRRGFLGVALLLFAGTAFAQVSIGVTSGGALRVGQQIAITTSAATPPLFRCADPDQSDPASASSCDRVTENAENGETFPATYTLVTDDAGRYLVAFDALTSTKSNVLGPVRTANPPTDGAATPLSLTAGTNATLTPSISDADTASAGDTLSYSHQVTAESAADVIDNASTQINPTTGVLRVAAGNAQGSASITITATDAGGESASQRMTVNVNAAPRVVGNPATSLNLSGAGVSDNSITVVFADGSDTLTFASSPTVTPSGVVTATYNETSGEVSVTAIRRGTASVAITATDGGGLTATHTISVSVANTDPVASTSVSDFSTPTGTTPNRDLRFTDADSDTLSYTESSDNPSVATATYDSATGRVRVDAKSRGTASISIAASDNQGGSPATATFSVTVTNAYPRVATSVANLSFPTGSVETRRLTFSDADGDSLSYGTPTSTNPRVATAVYNGSTGMVTVTAHARGTATIGVTADDNQPGSLLATAAFSVTVTNASPVVSVAVADFSVPTGSGGFFRDVYGQVSRRAVTRPLVFTDADGDLVRASDQNNDILHYTVSSTDSEVAVALYSRYTGRVGVEARARGTATITVTASDRQPGSTPATATFTVTVTNAAPVLAGNPPADLEINVRRGTTIGMPSDSRIVRFTDADGDTVSYSATSQPPGIVTVIPETGTASNNTGVISVRALTAGVATVTVTADDGMGGTTSVTFQATVNLANTAPTLTTAPLPLELAMTGVTGSSTAPVFSDAENDALSYSAEVASGSNVVSIQNVDTATGVVTVRALSRGTATIRVTADDGNGGTADATFSVNVLNAPPTANGTIADALISGPPITVRSTITDPERDTLTYSVTSAATDIATAEVTDQATGEVTVTAVKRGSVRITITADDGNGGQVSESFWARVRNVAPVAVTPTLPYRIISHKDRRQVITLMANFTDPDGDTLRYSAYPDYPNTVSVTPEIGTATNTTGEITVQLSNAFIWNYNRHYDNNPYSLNTRMSGVITATDGNGGTATQKFVILVNDPPAIGYRISEIPWNQLYPDDLTLKVGETVAATPPPVWLKNGWLEYKETLTFNVTSSAPGVASATLATTSEAFCHSNFPYPCVISNVNVTAVGHGTATITITADDGTDTSSMEFEVTVNAPPALTSTPPEDLTLALNGAAGERTVQFTDPDGDDSALSVFVDVTKNSGNGEIVTTNYAASTGQLTVTPVSAGTATVAVTAFDRLSAKHSVSFEVTVGTAPRLTTPALADLALNAHDSADTSRRVLFEDPDGGALTYSITGTDRLVAAVAHNPTSGVLEITPLFQGESEITITARDSTGLENSVSFTVRVNARPVAGNAPTNLALALGGAAGSRTAMFTDGSDALTYSAAVTASNPAGIVSVTPQTGVATNTTGIISVTPAAVGTIASGVVGTATITITATDPGGLSATQQFRVVVIENQAPRLYGTTTAPEDLDLVAGAGPDISRRARFEDPDGDDANLTYVITNSKSSVATVEHTAVTGMLTITPLTQGSTEISITARDTPGLEARVRFTVRVNAPPVPGAKPEKVILMAGASAVRQVRFTDAGDTLTCHAASSDTSLVSVTGVVYMPDQMGCRVRVRGEARTRNDVTVTVTATDGQASGGQTFTAQQTFSVTVRNSDPVAGTAPDDLDMLLVSGKTVTATRSANFSDADRDTLTYSVTGFDAKMVGVEVTDKRTGEITVTAKIHGITQVIITADDGQGGTPASQSFTVTVNGDPVSGTAPEAVVFMPGDTATRTASFHSMGDDLNYELVAGHDTEMVTAEVDTSTGRVLLTAQQKLGKTTVTIRAKDGKRGTATQPISVTVNGKPQVAETTLAPLAIQMGSSGTRSTAFTDPDNDKLSYAVQSSAEGIARAEVNQENGIVTVIGQGVGDATITVTADDNKGGKIQQNFAVRVDPAPADVRSNDNSTAIAIVLVAGAYKWWKNRRLANGADPTKMAMLPEVSFDLDRKDNRAFYTKMDWKNAPGSNWQLRGNATMHTKYSGELLDWKADSHIGYQLRGDWGSVNPYAKARYVNNNPHEEAMQETYTYGLNLSLRNRVNIQIVQPDSEVQRYSLNTQWQLPNRFSLRIAQPNSEVENYSLGLQWQGKRKIRYSLQGDIKDQSENNVYRLISTYTF